MKHGEIVGMAIKIHELVIYETTEEARKLRISSKLGWIHFIGYFQVHVSTVREQL